MSIDRVEGLVYGVDDVETCIRFMDDWGMTKIEAGEKGAVFETLEGQPAIIKHMSDASLPDAVEDGPTVREVMWGVDSQDSLDAIGAELSKDRDVSIDADGMLHSKDEMNIPIAFRVSQVKKLDEKAPALNFSNYVPRLNQTIEQTQDVRTRPYRFGHVVYAIPKQDRERAVSFYHDRLNFRLTDQVTGMGDFMCCDGHTYHHTWFLTHRGDATKFNHVAFEVPDFERIILGGKYMRDCNWETSRNPGRHNLGSNLHWYFKNPCGGEIEYFSDMDRMDDDWETRVWDEPPIINFWKAEVVL